MANTFTTAYDIKTAGGVMPYSADEINACIFSVLSVSVLVIVISFLVKRRRYVSLFALPIVASAVAGYLLLDVWDRHATGAALAAGNTKSVEGCVENFQTNTGDFYSSKSSKPDEQWDVHGEHFSYKVTSYAPGYHAREVRGGVVHKGQYLRVGYMISPVFRRKEIMKIEVGSNRCG